jgi:glycine/D-amino acid oxidase-like deaminating enzyme
VTRQPHVAVVGAGIVGASIAWHLAQAGAAVTIVEAGAGGGIATAASFAWINASWGNPHPYFRLRARSMADWRRLGAALPDLPLAWCGGLLWDLAPDELDAYARTHGAWGYGIRPVDRAAIRAIEPNLLDPPARAVHVAGEGAVEARPATLAFLADAARRGARLLTGSPVRTLVTRAGAVIGVETAAGRIDADAVVLAAGVATPDLAATAGATVHLAPRPGLLIESAPTVPLLSGIVIAPELELRQAPDGRLVIAADFEGDAEAAARATFAHATAMVRGAGALALDRRQVGLRPIPPDGFPIVGAVPGVPRLHVAVMHSGVTLAPAVGRHVTDLVLYDRHDPLFDPYGPARFAASA